MQTSYHDLNTDTWIDLRELCNKMTPSFTIPYRQLDARELGDFLDTTPPSGTINLGDQKISIARFLEYTKLSCPTLRASNYYLRNIRDGGHGGIDIMLPQHTPISSLTDGQVIRIKERDGNPNNEGNCIVIKAHDGYLVCYEHLESINVTNGQQISQGDIIGTCGTTGNSTQFHLHLQIDKGHAPFHPYRSDNAAEMEQRTIDPLPYLRAHAPDNPFHDLPVVSPFNEAILALAYAGIIKGFNHQIYPNNLLQRYEMALLMDRILLKYVIYDQLPVVNPVYTPYLDVSNDDPELIISLERLQKYGIMKGHNNSFYPHNPLKGDELLALLGRVFYNLADSNTTPWYQAYVEKFIAESLISTEWKYLEKSIPRKEVFLLIYRLLVREGYLHD